jgi:Raf kinase inhibitor-like YbhB/YbcL family protein
MKAMKRLIFFVILLGSAIAAYYLFVSKQKQIVQGVLPPTKTMEQKQEDMKLTSSAFVHDQAIPKEYTCDGENVSPPLSISGVPKGTKSLTLIVEDPDAPAGVWVHWILWNMNPDTHEISQGKIPEVSFEGTTSFGKPGYGGPCPPTGTHRYFFTLYALDISLGLTNQATSSDVEQAMKGHSIAQTQLIGRYGR